MGRIVCIPRQVGTNADKDRRANCGGSDADLSMYNRYNANSSYIPRLSKADMVKAEAIHTNAEAPAVYTKVY